MIADTSDICAGLAAVAREEPGRTAVIAPEGQLTALQLDQLSDRCAAGLSAAGVAAGTRTVLMVTPGLRFMVLTFALVKLGAVLVVVDPGIGWRNLKTCLAEARPEAFVGIPRAHLGRLLFGWARATVRVCVSVGAARMPGWIPYERLLRPQEAAFIRPILSLDQPAAIVFTSGSTGVPKGVLFTHRMFNAQARLLQAHFNIRPGEVDLATFPLFALFDPAMKVTPVFPKMDFTKPARANPKRIAETVRRHQVTHMFGSPALLDRLGRYAEPRQLKLPSLKRVLSAGAPVPDHVLVRIQKMLTGEAALFTPYGATEALPVCSISGGERLSENGTGKGVCIGRPLGGVGLAVVRITDDPLPAWTDDLIVPDGEIGELVVWGDNVSTSYFERPEANATAKIRGLHGEIRHRMGDVGFRDAQGRVWFCGRKSHRVVTPAGTLFTIPCESVFNQHPAVFRTALVGIGPRPVQHPVLCVEPEDKPAHPDRVKLRAELLEIGASCPVTRTITDIRFHPGFPVDIRHNAKIFREKLAQWAGGQP